MEIETGKYCDKETFIKEFEKLNFDEFKIKKDLAVEDTIKVFLDKYLEMYDEDGWLMLSNYEDLKKQLRAL